jgi:hypothetical protein
VDQSPLLATRLKPQERRHDDLAVLSAEIANGMYRKPIDEIAKEFRYDPLPHEVLAVIAAWRRGGLLPASAIDKLAPESLK